VTGSRRVVLGRIVSAHGLGGWLRVRTFSDPPYNLMRASELMLGAVDDDPGLEVRAVEAREQGRPGEVRMRLAGVADREAAEALRGRLILVDEAEIERLPEGEYYEYELIGCRVEDEEGQTIGTVSGVWSTGAADLLVIDGESGEQQLIPAGGEFLREVDVKGRRIAVALIPGLIAGR
jgi:16S rRNA processing protein RimM